MRRGVGVYHSYEQVTAILEGWAASHPLCSLESLGQAADGKEVWMLTINDASTGAACDKPAFWLDANMHAGEVTGCEAALHFVGTLLGRWDAEDEWTRAVLAEAACLVVPRISPDGAEFMLTTPYSCRSSPVQLDPLDFPGFVADDVDGNGKCLLMRQEDPAGAYKASEQDPRIMVQRLPHERGGTYYRLFPEGSYRGPYDGTTQRVAPGAAYSLDANRQYPFNYEPEGGQRGAGDLPGHLPQVRACYEAIAARPNIAMLMNYHTYGAMVIRPPEEELGSDFGTYDALTQLGCDLTGYAPIVLSNAWMHGDSVAWAIEHRGIVCFCVELWNGMEHVLKLHDEEFDHTADLGSGPVSPNMVGTREEDFARLYQFLDENFAAEEYVQSWSAFEHPQLGAVEIGGMDSKKCVQNPPPALLEAECEKNTAFSLALLGSLPAVQTSVATEPLDPEAADVEDGGPRRVRVTLSNQGFLPTYGAQRAVDMKVVRAHGVATLRVSGDVTLLHGEALVEVPHLSGRSAAYDGESPVASAWGASAANPHEATVEWVVQGSGTLDIEVDYQRGGKHRCSVHIGGGAAKL